MFCVIKWILFDNSKMLWVWAVSRLAATFWQDLARYHTALEMLCFKEKSLIMAMGEFIRLSSPVTQNSFSRGKIRHRPPSQYTGVTVAWQLQAETVQASNSWSDHRGQWQTGDFTRSNLAVLKGQMLDGSMWRSSNQTKQYKMIAETMAKGKSDKKK